MSRVGFEPASPHILVGAYQYAGRGRFESSLGYQCFFHFIDNKGVSLFVVLAHVDLKINLRSGDLFLTVVEEWKYVDKKYVCLKSKETRLS